MPRFEMPQSFDGGIKGVTKDAIDSISFYLKIGGWDKILTALDLGLPDKQKV